MARSFFTFYPGLSAPERFRAGAAPRLLSAQDLWEEAKSCTPSLIFRVRSENDPLGPLSAEDSLESCVGMIDAATRWRCVFNMTRTAINAVRHPVLADACFKAMQFISTQHPANVSPAQRHNILNEIMKIAAGQLEGATIPDANEFEKQVASGVAALVLADSDVEAAHLAPFVRAYCPFDQETQRPQYGARMTSIETIAGATLLTEAGNRLAERLPSWLYATMPELGAAKAGAKDEED